MKTRTEISNKYNRENTKTYLLRLNKRTDTALIRWLDCQDNKSGYIKNLILKDIINDRKGIDI